MISVFLLIFVIYPILGNSHFDTLFANLFFIIVLISGLISVDLGSNIKKYLFIFISVTIILSIFGELYESDYLIRLHLVARLIYLWILVILIFIKVFKTEGASYFYRIAGSVTIYFLIGFIWSNMFFIFYILNPASFHFINPVKAEDNTMFNFIYFSFVTLTTLGFGDILPVNTLLKSLVILEALIGPLYLAILIGRLVSLQTAAKK